MEKTRNDDETTMFIVISDMDGVAGPFFNHATRPCGATRTSRLRNCGAWFGMIRAVAPRTARSCTCT
jgi:hypothetical protein